MSPWTCFASANPCPNLSPSSSGSAWMPPCMHRLREGCRVATRELPASRGPVSLSCSKGSKPRILYGTGYPFPRMTGTSVPRKSPRLPLAGIILDTHYGRRHGKVDEADAVLAKDPGDRRLPSGL